MTQDNSISCAEIEKFQRHCASKLDLKALSPLMHALCSWTCSTVAQEMETWVKIGCGNVHIPAFVYFREGNCCRICSTAAQEIETWNVIVCGNVHVPYHTALLVIYCTGKGIIWLEMSTKFDFAPVNQQSWCKEVLRQNWPPNSCNRWGNLKSKNGTACWWW